MSKYPSYDEMKDSGIEWLGEIPEHWGMVKLKYITSCLDNRRIPLNSSERSEMQGEYPYYGANGIVDWVNDFIFDEKIILLGEDGAPFKEFGKEVAFLINEKCWVNNHAHILKADGINPIFLTYSLNCVNYNPYLSGSTRYKLTQNDMKKINIAFPPLKEQQAIADFLDRETGRIEELIEKKEKLIELLEEKRQSTINQAVTKGLDSDVEMKDSGVEWLGDIPEHWSMVKLRRIISKFVDYRGRTPTKTKSGIPLITARNINDGKLNHEISPEYISKEDYKEWMVRGFPEVGDVLLTTEAPLGEVAQVKNPHIALAQRIILFKSNEVYIIDNYLKYHFLSRFGQSELLSNATGSTARGIKASRLKATRILIPSLEEQEEIADYLDQETNRIDNLIDKTKEQIANLKEYKQALISNAVTGKIKVTEEL